MNPLSRSSWFSKPPTKDITLEDAKKYLSPSPGKYFEEAENMSRFGKIWTSIKTVASAKWERIQHKRKTGGLLKGEWYDNAAVCSLIAAKIQKLNQKINNPEELTNIQTDALELYQICELLKSSGAKQVKPIEDSIKTLFDDIKSKSNIGFFYPSPIKQKDSKKSIAPASRVIVKKNLKSSSSTDKYSDQSDRESAVEKANIALKEAQIQPTLILSTDEKTAELLNRLKQDVDKQLNKCNSALMGFENKSDDKRNIALKKARKALNLALDPLFEIRKYKFKEAYKEANRKYDVQEQAINDAQAKLNKTLALVKNLNQHKFQQENLEKLEEVAIEPVIQFSEEPHASILLASDRLKNSESKKPKKNATEAIDLTSSTLPSKTNVSTGKSLDTPEVLNEINLMPFAEKTGEKKPIIQPHPAAQPTMTADPPLPLVPFSNPIIQATQVTPAIQLQNSQTCFTDLEIQQARGACIKELQNLSNLILANTTFLEKLPKTISISDFIYNKIGNKEVGSELNQAARNVPIDDHGAVLAKDMQPVIQALKKTLNILKKREHFQQNECYQKLLEVQEHIETVENNRKFSVQTHAKRVRSPIEVCKNQLSDIKNKHPADSLKALKYSKSALKDAEEQIVQYKAAGYEADLVSKGYAKEIKTLKNSIKAKKEEIRQKAALEVLNITDHLDSFLGSMTSEKIIQGIRKRIQKEASNSQKIRGTIEKEVKAFLLKINIDPFLGSSIYYKPALDFFSSIMSIIDDPTLNDPNLREILLAETFNASKNEKSLSEARANLEEAENLLKIAKSGDLYELASKRLTEIKKRLVQTS